MSKSRVGEIIIVKIITALSLGCVILVLIANHLTVDRTNWTEVSTSTLIEIVNDPSTTKLGFATTELARRGEFANKAVPALARAMFYPRRDSFQAAIALASIGPNAFSITPVMIKGLSHHRVEVRKHSILVLGTIEEAARCAIPEIASHLWDEDATVRTMAAIVLDHNVGVDLLPFRMPLDPSLAMGIALDEPEGALTEKARVWWKEQGQYIDWQSGSEADNCVINSP